MKNAFLKKLLVCSCCGVVALTGLTFAGCSKEKVQETTEAVIETATNILPFEYSAALAKGILFNACTNSLEQNNIQSQYINKNYSFGGMGLAGYDVNATSIYINNNGLISEKLETNLFPQKVYTLTIKTGDEYNQYAVIGNKYKEMINNSATSTTSFPSAFGRLYLAGSIQKSSDDGRIETMSALSNVIGGKYYNGKTYINALIEFDDAVNTIETGHNFNRNIFSVQYEIVNEQINAVKVMKNIKLMTYGSDLENKTDAVFVSESNETETVSFIYGNQTISDAPRALTGLTLDSDENSIYFIQAGYNA